MVLHNGLELLAHRRYLLAFLALIERIQTGTCCIEIGLARVSQLDAVT